MSTEQLVVIIAVAWIAIGLALSVLMGRRGHEAFSWFVLGSLLGPLAIALAVDARRHLTTGDTSFRRPGSSGTGSTDVVVGADGSPQSRAAVRGVVDLFGPALGRLSLVAVVPYDATHETERDAHHKLVGEALDIRDREVELHVVRGEAAAQLQAFVQAGDYEVLAIGTRGSGLARALLGSVAADFARGSQVPVLLFSNAESRTSAVENGSSHALPVGHAL